MDKPRRIQRRRTKGWRMPQNTIYVGRGTVWGNPFPTHQRPLDGRGLIVQSPKVEVRSPDEAVRLYASSWMPYNHRPPHCTMQNFLLSEANLTIIQHTLRGKNLACWCSLDQPCHADWLLEVANEEPYLCYETIKKHGDK